MKTRKQSQLSSSGLSRFLQFGTLAILFVVPLLTPVIVWLGSQFGHFNAFKLIKEFWLAALSVLFLVWLIKQPKLRQALKSPLMSCILAYILLTLGIAIYDVASNRVSNSAVIFGLVINLRFVVFFSLVYLLRFGSQNLQVNWQKLVFIPAAIVISFGLLQQFVLPKNALSHIGYNQQTTYEPYETIDNHPNLVRIQSSLRGPNPLGAYLVVILSLILAVIMLISPKRPPPWLLILGSAGLIVLVGTYSRSAWVGLLISGAVIAGLTVRQRIPSSWIGIAALSLLVLLTIGFVLLRNTDQFQNLVFHTSNRSTSPQSSNAQRANGLETAGKSVLHHPLGTGVGSAGPASVHNANAPASIAENYYLQIAQEVGWLGLGLFIVIELFIVVELWKRRTNALALGLLASLAGLTFICLVSHAWSDDTLAYVWWGLAGLVLAQPLTNNHKGAIL